MSMIKPPQAYVSADRATALLGKWKKMLDYTDRHTSPIVETSTRLNTAIILENQMQWCNEANLAASGGAFGTHAQGGAGDARLPRIVMPMIRRTFPELIANDIVGVQPMSGPIGIAFAMRLKYDRTAIGAQSANGRDGSLGLNASSDRGLAGTNGKELGYQYLDSSFTGALSTEFDDTTVTATFATVTERNAGLATAIVGAVYKQLDTNKFYTKTSLGAWLEVADPALSNFGTQNMAMLDIDKGVAALLGDLEYSSKIGQITTTFEKTGIEAGTRKLASTFSLELEADLRNMTGINIRDELINAMAYEVQAEIDRELCLKMIKVCVKKAGYGKGWSTWSPANADGRFQLERARTLYQRIIIEAQRVGVRNRIGPANFIVATPTIIAILEALPEFQWVKTEGNVTTKTMGVAKVGTIGGGRFDVYRDMKTEGQYENGDRSVRAEYCLLGFKGQEYWNTGIVYCPYIPLMVQETTGPNDFSPRIGMFTRYGVVENLFGAELFYHTIFVTGLEDDLDGVTGKRFI